MVEGITAIAPRVPVLAAGDTTLVAWVAAVVRIGGVFGATLGTGVGIIAALVTDVGIHPVLGTGVVIGATIRTGVVIRAAAEANVVVGAADRAGLVISAGSGADTAAGTGSGMGSRACSEAAGYDGSGGGARSPSLTFLDDGLKCLEGKLDGAT